MRNIIRVKKPVFGLSKLRQYELNTDTDRVILKDTENRHVVSIPISRINELDVTDNLLAS